MQQVSRQLNLLSHLFINPRDFFSSHKSFSVKETILFAFSAGLVSYGLFIVSFLISTILSNSPINWGMVLLFFLAFLGAVIGILVNGFGYHYRVLHWDGKQSLSYSIFIGVFSLSPFLLILFLFFLHPFLPLLGLVFGMWLYYNGLKVHKTDHSAVLALFAIWGVIRAFIGGAAFSILVLMALNFLIGWNFT